MSLITMQQVRRAAEFLSDEFDALKSSYGEPIASDIKALIEMTNIGRIRIDEDAIDVAAGKMMTVMADEAPITGANIASALTHCMELASKRYDFPLLSVHEYVGVIVMSSFALRQHWNPKLSRLENDEVSEPGSDGVRQEFVTEAVNTVTNALGAQMVALPDFAAMAEVGNRMRIKFIEQIAHQYPDSTDAEREIILGGISAALGALLLGMEITTHGVIEI